MLAAARRRAEEMTQSGALFPWRTINGEEASAYYAAGTAQYHINADIAFALASTSPPAATWIPGREGVEILVETARLWADLGFWRSNGDGGRSSTSTASPDPTSTPPSSTTTCTPTSWRASTCAKAAEVLRQLQRELPRAYRRVVARLELDDDEIDEWAACAEAMYIPYDEAPASTRRTRTSSSARSGT